MKLVPNWREGWRMWSIRLNALGTFLMGWILVWPESALTLWQLVPAEARSVLPPRFVMIVPLICFALATGARVIKQRKLNAPKTAN